MIYLETLTIILVIQLVFFLFAALKKTDLVTDLSYGLTFVVVALWQVFSRSTHNLQAVVLTMVVLWGLRLSAYLFWRILVMKRDQRFDGIRENFFKFAQFWMLQGISIWLILLPVVTAMTISINQFTQPGIEPWETFRPAPLPWLTVTGILIWLVGLILETTADWQKFVFKNNPITARTWVESGIWRYSRHPNYFGEMLCWWGVFLAVAPGLTGWQWLTILSPSYITFLLLFVTGIPTLEKKYAINYAKNQAYQDYRRRTSLLIPWWVKN